MESNYTASSNFATIEPIDFWLPVVVVLAFNFLFFIFAQQQKDNSWIDTFWGLTFIEPIAALIIAKLIAGEPIPARTWLIFAMVTCWGLRLALYIGLRHKTEDFRYQDMRKRWMEGGYCAYVTKAFFYVFMAQGIYSIICNAACLYVVIAGPNDAL